MDVAIQFNFRTKVYSCLFYVDNSENPCLIFVVLNDKELIKEFEEEITIETDCVKLLPKKDDYRELVALRQAVFDTVKTTPEFIIAKRNMMLKSQSQSGFLTKD